MTDKLVAWLGKQIDADEAAARGVLEHLDNGLWETFGWPEGIHGVSDDHTNIICTWDDPSQGLYAAAHIARHDPARVLREIAAKREVLKHHDPEAWADSKYSRQCPSCAEDSYDPVMPLVRASSPCTTLKLLAAVYADRDGYEAAIKG